MDGFSVGARQLKIGERRFQNGERRLNHRRWRLFKLSMVICKKERRTRGLTSSSLFMMMKQKLVFQRILDGCHHADVFDERRVGIPVLNTELTLARMFDLAQLTV